MRLHMRPKRSHRLRQLVAHSRAEEPVAEATNVTFFTQEFGIACEESPREGLSVMEAGAGENRLTL